MLDTLHTKIASAWGNLGAWVNAGYLWAFAGMAPITALSTFLACMLTIITILDRLRQRQDAEDLKRAIEVAEETGLDQLRDVAAGMLERKSGRRRR